MLKTWQKLWWNDLRKEMCGCLNSLRKEMCGCLNVLEKFFLPTWLAAVLMIVHLYLVLVTVRLLQLVTRSFCCGSVIYM